MRRFAQFALVALCAVAVALSAAATQASGEQGNPNAAVFPRLSQPYGADMATWGERATQWVYAQPLELSPLFDPTGANCAVGQEGPVWYVARIAGPPIFSGERSCTIPHGKTMFLYIGAAV